MHTKARSATFFLVILVILLAGCGGGSGGAEDEQGSQADQGKQGAPEARKDAPEAKIALGTVKRVNYEKERIVIRPSQGEGLMTFGIRQGARITVDDKEAEFKDVKKDQQAQIEYIQNNDLKRASSVKLFSAGGEETN